MNFTYFMVYEPSVINTELPCTSSVGKKQSSFIICHLEFIILISSTGHFHQKYIFQTRRRWFTVYQAGKSLDSSEYVPPATSKQPDVGVNHAEN